MHSVKQQRKREEEVIEIDGLQLLLPDRGKDGGREYEPPRLENSLGKLQVVSVNAPRKIIDLQVVHLDPSHPTTPMQREMRKHRHLLLYVEKVRPLTPTFVLLVLACWLVRCLLLQYLKRVKSEKKMLCLHALLGDFTGRVLG